MNRLAGAVLALFCGSAAVTGLVTVAGPAAAATGRAALPGQAAATGKPATGKPAAQKPALRQPAVAYDCHGQHQGQVRAPEVIVDCLFGNVFVRTPSWKYWTAISARTATATLWANNCKPNCAAGTFRKYPATLVLYRPRTAAGTRYFTRMRLEYQHNGPRSYTFRWGVLPGATLPGWNGGP
ncbi:MAG: hypothetical protein ABJB47_17235 [Actinomycetota bacterium]